MLHNPTRHRLARFADQQVRSAEVVVEMEIRGRLSCVVHLRFWLS
jgi:hypothetical protein